MSNTTFHQIKKLLDTNNIKYQVFDHEPVRTSEEAAAVRERLFGIKAEDILKRGAKAMIVMVHHKPYQLIISAAKRIDFKKAKALLGGPVTFATEEDVVRLTDCLPGSVPPFGNLFDIPVYVDNSLLANETIDFNAGEKTVSMILNTKNWLSVVNPTMADFS